MSRISQREAKRLRKRVAELEAVLDRQYNTWGDGFIGGTHLATVARDGAIDREVFGRLDAARRLRHAVVINAHSDGVKFYALPLRAR